MVELQTSFTFKDGKMSDYDKIVTDLEMAAVMFNIFEAVRPTIEEQKLTGKLILYISEKVLNIAFEGEQARQTMGLLTQVIYDTYPGTLFSDN